MKRFLIISIFSISTALVTSNFPASAVYNGSDAIGSPFLVNVITENVDGNRYGGCSGALIAPRIVITAAHCVTENQSGLLAKNVWVSPPGATYKTTVENEKTYSILENTSSLAASRAIYEQYRAVSIKITSTYLSTGDEVTDNDIAFLVLDKALPLTVDIVIASNAETQSFIKNKTAVKIYGYGQTIFQDTEVKKPKTATMNFSSLSAKISDSAYLTSSTSSACPGDSGGPVIVSTPTKLYLVGIITGGAKSTTGPECNAKSGGSFYTLITLITEYANLVFASSKEAIERSEKARVLAEESIELAKNAQAKAEADAKAAADAKAKADLDAKAATQAQAKAEADAKAAADAKAKADLDAKAATQAQAKAEEQAKIAIEAQTQAEAIAGSYLQARGVTEGELAKLKTDFASLSAEILGLNAAFKLIQAQNALATKKLALICKVKPKPKGC